MQIRAGWFAQALILVLAAAWSTSARAVIVIDGSLAGDGYGAPAAVQTVNTGFGNNDGINKGSELNAAYARVEGGALNIALTGNLEDNFNKLVLFIDSRPGGQNVLDADVNSGGSNPIVDQSPFSGDPGMFQKMSVLGPTTLDAGFLADYVLVLRHGFTGVSNRFDVDFAELGGGASQYLGVFDPTSSFGGATGTGVNLSPIVVGFNNSNTGGVDSGTGTADGSAAAAATTGVEIALSLADLGGPALNGTVKVTAYITNSNHDFVSNQFLGGLPDPSANLGSDSFSNFIAGGTLFDLNDFAGDQFFSVNVIPEVSSMLCVGAAGLAALAVKRVRGRRRISAVAID